MARCGEDLDGVGHVFGDSFHNWLIHTGRGHLWKSGPTKKPFWNWFEDWGWSAEQFVEECNAAADAGILFNGPLRPGYKEGIDELAAMGHTIIIHTDRPFGSTPEVSEKITVEWLRENEVYWDELWFGRNKWESNCDFFIEDNLDNYDALVSRGVKAFLLNRPWNEVEGGDARNRIDTFDQYVEAIRHSTQEGYAQLSLV